MLGCGTSSAVSVRGGRRVVAISAFLGLSWTHPLVRPGIRLFIDFGRRAALAGATGCDRLGVGVLSPAMLSMRKRMSDSRSNRLRPLPLGASLAVSMRNGDEAQSSSCARLLAHERFAVIVVLRDVGSAFCPLLSAEHVWSGPRSAASTHHAVLVRRRGDAGFAPAADSASRLSRSCPGPKQRT